MSDDMTTGIGIGFSGAVILGTLLIIVLSGYEVDAWHRAIVKHHAGHYVINPETGASKFVWNDEIEENKK